MLTGVISIQCAPLATTTRIQPSQYHRYTQRTIQILTRDGRLIEFRGNRYRVIERAYSVEIEGRGILLRNRGVYVGRPIEAHLSEQDIYEVSVVKRWDPSMFGAMLTLFILFISPAMS